LAEPDPTPRGSVTTAHIKRQRAPVLACRVSDDALDEHQHEDGHPTRLDLALQNLKCADRGAVKTKVLSLKPGASPPKLAA
jgi:hypothetical protein